MRAALLLLLAAARAGADPDVFLELTPCVLEEAPREPLMRLLRVELAAPSQPPIVLVTDGGEAANVRVNLDCGERPSLLEVQIERRQPRGSYRGTIDLLRLPAGLRPRTIALAIAENLRWLDEPAPPAEAPQPSPSPAPRAAEIVPTVEVAPAAAVEVAPTTASLQRTLRNPIRMRTARNWTIGLGVTALVVTVIGAPILSSGVRYHPPDVGMLAGGSVMITLAAVSLAGTGVGFGYWLRERLRPVE